MKKTRIIAMAMALAIALMGASYAAWADRVRITGTVETGNLKVELKEGTKSTYVIDEKGEKDSNIEKYGLTALDQINGNFANVKLDNIIPGTEFERNYTVLNKSTIPVNADLNFVFKFGNKYYPIGAGRPQDKGEARLSDDLDLIVKIGDSMLSQYTVGDLLYSGTNKETVLKSLTDELNKALSANNGSQEISIFVVFGKDGADNMTMNKNFEMMLELNYSPLNIK